VASSSAKGEAFSVSRLIFVTGGARSGKSRFALSLAERGSFRRRLFVATAVACDGEMRRRIRRHRKERNGFWLTLEEPLRLPERLPASHLRPGGAVLLDCLPTFVTNHLLARRSSDSIRHRVRRLLARCRRPGVTTFLISNEVGLGLVPENALGRRFRDLLGVVNQQAAQAADEVYLLVAGQPLRIK